MGKENNSFKSLKQKRNNTLNKRLPLLKFKAEEARNKLIGDSTQKLIWISSTNHLQQKRNNKFKPPRPVQAVLTQTNFVTREGLQNGSRNVWSVHSVKFWRSLNPKDFQRRYWVKKNIHEEGKRRGDE